MGQILIIVSVVLTFLTAVFGFLNQGKISSARSAAEAAKAELSGAQAKATKAEGDLKKAAESVAALNTEKEQTVAQLTAAQSELNTAKNTTIPGLTNQISDKDKQITQLDADVKAKQAEIDRLIAAGTTPTGPTEEQTLKDQEQQTVITKLQGELDAARTQLGEFRKKEEDEKALRMRNGLEGRILAVNQAWNFVVLNLGDRNGVINNAEMLIKRGTQLIGKVRITSVEPSTSIADIVANSVPGGVTVQPGDNVIYQAVETQ